MKSKQRLRHGEKYPSLPPPPKKPVPEGYAEIQIATEHNFWEQIGKEIFFGLVDYEKAVTLIAPKLEPFQVVKNFASGLFHVEEQYQRFWPLGKWQNITYPHCHPLTPTEEEETVEKLSTKFHNAEIKLFLEIPPRQGLMWMPLPIKAEDEILLFLKFFDHDKCRYAGRMFVKGRSKPTAIVNKLIETFRFALHQEIEFYKEISCVPTALCYPLNKKRTFRSSKFVDGDILWFQKSPSFQHHQLFRYPDVPSYFKYLRDREVVQFRFLGQLDGDMFSLELSNKCTYAQVVCKVAQKLGLDDPSKIWITTQYGTLPLETIKFRPMMELPEMLMPYDQKSGILYFETKEIPLPEWECLQTLKVAFRSANVYNEMATYHISLPRESTVADLIDEIKAQVGLLYPTADLRLLEVFCSKIYKIFSVAEKIEYVTDQYYTLRADEVPEEEKDLGPRDRFIHVYHFKKKTGENQVEIENFGDPFLFVIKVGETLRQIKTRMQMKLHVSVEEFSKWNFAYIAIGRLEYLNDADIIWNWFQTANISGSWEQYLGVEHSSSSDKFDPARSSEKVDPPSSSKKRPYPIFEHHRTRPLKIRG